MIETLLCELISRKSITGSEKSVLDFVSGFLEEQGFLVEKLEVAEGRYNIFCSIDAPKVCFNNAFGCCSC